MNVDRVWLSGGIPGVQRCHICHPCLVIASLSPSLSLSLSLSRSSCFLPFDPSLSCLFNLIYIFDRLYFHTTREVKVKALT